MTFYKLYSKRLREANQEKSDFFEYDNLPKTFRVQVAHILNDSIDKYKNLWEYIHEIMCRELGVFRLSNSNVSYADRCVDYLLTADFEGTIDIIELSFKLIEIGLKNDAIYVEGRYLKMNFNHKEAIEELNYRFLEHGLGYEFVNGQIIRVDSKYLHQESIKPAIKLLYEEGFEGPSDEFFNAHEHYRNKKYKESIVESLKAFESTMKAICDKLNLSYNIKDTAANLIKILVENELIPSFLTSHYTSLKSTLECGLPTVRNKTSSHGQGANTIDIPPYLASYAINLAAVNIVFLVNAYKSKTA